MPKKSEEVKVLLEEKAYWEEISNLIDGWRLLGWTYKEGATYVNKDNQTIHLTGWQRDDLVHALKTIGHDL